MIDATDRSSAGTYRTLTQTGQTWLSARCGTSKLARLAHGITCRCSGRWWISALWISSARRISASRFSAFISTLTSATIASNFGLV